MSTNVPEIRKFDPGLGIHFERHGFRFTYDEGVFHPEKAELRRLDAIRATLLDPQSTGPDPVYAIAMDVGRNVHATELKRRMLLFGVVAYAAGRLGSEPVRSQGHIHAIAPHCGWSTPEVVEVWEGSAIIYLQKAVADDPEYCVAIEASPGEVVVIPPTWAHYIVNADPTREMVFGAFCDRQYGFVYEDVRRRGGLAWFPRLKQDDSLEWVPNAAYSNSALKVRRARQYPEFRLTPVLPLYEQFACNPERFQWVSEPAIYADLWENFEP